MSGVMRGIGQVAGIVASVAMFIPGGQGVAAIAGAISVVASVGAQVTAKKPVSERQGMQLSFKIDANSPIYYPIGRTAVGGVVIHRETYGTANHYQTYFVDLGLGPIQGIETFLADRAAIAFSGTSAVGYYGNWMWQDRQLGALPEARALGHGVTSPPYGSIPAQVPGWSAQHKLSGHAAASWTMLFDTKARRYAQGEPQPGWILLGNRVWDPRLDSTYPGGSGPCRRDDPSTHVYSETPALHGLKWRLGVYQNGKRVMGVGAPVDLIDIARIVESANVQEANGWKVGGELNSGMDRWEALKLIEQAGGAEPVPSAALMSTLQKMPRVSVGEITDADLAPGRLAIPGGQTRRQRINGFRARYRSEAHGWEMVPIDLVQIADYVAADGVARAGSGDYALVQNKDQAAQLAAYEVYDGREITLPPMPLKPRFIGYRIGDLLTANLTELGLVDQPVIVRARRIDPKTGIVTLTLQTETAGKHAEALGRTGNAPPVPRLTYDPLIVPAPSLADWTALGGTVSNGAGHSIPALIVTGAVGNSAADGVVFDFRRLGTTDWTNPSIDAPDTVRKVMTDVAPETAYQIGIRYKVAGVIGDRLILGPFTTGVDSTAVAVDGKTRVFIQDTAPTAEESAANDLWINTAEKNKLYARTDGAGALAVGGDVITFGGQRIFFSLWTPHADQRIVDALLAAADAEALAATKSRSFSQEEAPDAPGIGDKWYRPSTGIERRWDGAAWQATTDRTALTQHSIPQITDVRVGATYAGAIKSGQLPQSRFVQRLVGNTDVSAQAQIAATATGGVAITVNNAIDSARRGLITIDPQATLPAECTIRGTSTFDAVSIPFSFKIYRDDDPIPAAGGGAGSGGGASGAASTNSFTAPGTQVAAIEMGRCAAVTTGSAGKVAVSCPLTYYANDSGEFYGEQPVGSALTARVEYSTNGGTSWTAADAGHTGGGAYQGFESGPRKYDYYEVGYGRGPVDAAASVDASVTITGLGAGASVLIRVTGQWDGFGAGISTVEGTLAALPS